jgi:hypothetical protein
MAPFKIMWKNTAEPERPQMAICRMRFVCCIAKARNTRLENEILSLFRSKIIYTNVPQYYVIRTLPVFFLYRILGKLDMASTDEMTQVLRIDKRKRNRKSISSLKIFQHEIYLQHKCPVLFCAKCLSQ